MIAPIVITILFCGGIFLHMFSKEKHEKLARVAAANAEIREAGFSCEGDPFEQAQMGVSEEGLDIRLSTQCEQPLPGKTSVRKTVCFVSMNVEGPDMLICRKSDSDEIMGPLPTALRFPLGDATFDEEYVAYAGGEVSGGKESGYRGGPERPPISWAQPAILQRLQDFGLIWLRVRDGEAEIAFQPVRYKRALATLRLARVIALGHRNVDSDELGPLEKDGPAPPKELATARLRTLGIVLFYSLIMFGPILTAHSDVHHLARTVVCPPGTADDLLPGDRCRPYRIEVGFISYWIGAALAFTPVTLIISLITLVQWYRRKAGR